MLAAALTAPLAVVAGAMAADALPATSDPLKDPAAISQSGARALPAGRDAERASRVAQPEYSAGRGHRDCPGGGRGHTAG